MNQLDGEIPDYNVMEELEECLLDMHSLLYEMLQIVRLQKGDV